MYTQINKMQKSFGEFIKKKKKERKLREKFDNTENCIY